MKTNNIYYLMLAAALHAQPAFADETAAAVATPAAAETAETTPTAPAVRTTASGRPIVAAGQAVTGSAAPVQIPALRYLDADPSIGQPTRYLIPHSMVPTFVKSFHVEIVSDDEGNNRLDLSGWIPKACVNHIEVRLGSVDGNEIFDESSNKYPIHIEGRAVVDSEGNIVTPEECFAQNPATRCNLSRNLSQRNCVSIDELASVQSAESHLLGPTGDVVLRTDSDQLDERTGLPAAPTDGPVLAHHMSYEDVVAEERREAFVALCNAAQRGDRAAIERLADLRGMAGVAQGLLQRANDADYAEIVAMPQTTIREIELKAAALASFSRDYSGYRDRTTEALMALAEAAKELEPGESDNDIRFANERYRVRERILNDAAAFGHAPARLAADTLVIERAHWAATTPGVAQADYIRYRNQGERVLRRLHSKVRSAMRRGQQPSEELAGLINAGDQFLSARDGFGRRVSDLSYAQARQQAQMEALRERQEAQYERALSSGSYYNPYSHSPYGYAMPQYGYPSFVMY